ncbi:class I adenylate-forming enzyme family protein [Acetobacterium bakii]|uniref:AMP-binding protein n=1 Tax=Acetobacterium bakii TaxID=52689 RepID=A0A0L6TZB9_9FIRM|nr:class I adenylate-forming enzyme family protein [Acetobacterium bakii]KNZ41619.1 hypothetical protein AKG39_11595 [Acetobacterium bakii]
MELKSITIIEQFYEVLKDKKDEIAVVYENESFSWIDIDLISDRIAINLIDDNIGKDDHVALWSYNTPAWICCYLAIAKIGAVSVLINPKIVTHEAKYLMEFGDVDYICYGDNLKGNPSEIITKTYPCKSIGRESFHSLSKLAPLSESDRIVLQSREDQAESHDMASMLFTSGSTSKPKGILLSNYQLINIAREAVETMQWTKNDKFCLALPLFHSFGLSTGLLASLIHGGSLFLNSVCKTKSIMEVIDNNQCTVLNAVPSQFLAIIHHNERENYSLNSLNSGIIAGSTVYQQDYLKIIENLGILHLMQSYGQTEASPSITFPKYEDSLELRSKTVGKKISNIQLRIVSMESGKQLAANEPGKIEISGYNVMHGYYKDDVESNKVLSKDGWLQTGDIGYLDREGNLYVVGRIKELIIRSGENISPKEIEEIILLNEYVHQVKVFGIPMSIVQEEIVACVECPTGKTSVEEIRELIKEHLADYKMPKYIIIYKKFPHNASFKIDVRTMKEDLLLKIQEERKNDF